MITFLIIILMMATHTAVIDLCLYFIYTIYNYILFHFV